MCIECHLPKYFNLETKVCTSCSVNEIYDENQKKCVDCPSDKPVFDGTKCVPCPKNNYYRK